MELGLTGAELGNNKTLSKIITSRRSIQNKTASTYVCRRAKNCEINLKTRKNCQFCRYSRCLTVGMKPTWVLSEEERQRRFRKNRDKQEQGGAQGGGKR